LSVLPSTTQSITPAISNLLLWGTTDASQTTGTTGLVYAAGLFTNNTAVPLPLLFEYAVFLNTTGSGMSCIGINGSALAYGVMYNDNNCFTNSYTILLQPGYTVGIYYMDNGSPTVLTTSCLSITLLTAGQQGPTGTQGPVGQVAIFSAVPSTTQNVGANTLTAVLWGNTDALQSTGNTGLVYTSSNGTFINNTGLTLPILVQYSLMLNLTGSGYSYVGVTTALSVFTSYGMTYNDTNGFNNAYTVLLAPGASVGVYYTDTLATVVQTTSRISLTLLTAGQAGYTGSPGVTGPVGSVAKWSVNPSVATQTIPSNALTLVSWGSTIASQTTGTTGLTYAAGLFTNNTSVTIPLLVDYSMFVSYTGGGYTVVGINGSTTVYGGRYNDNIAITNSVTVLLTAGSTLGVYYMDNASTTLLNTSQLSITVLTAGPQGPTGPSQWGATGSNTLYYSGNVIVGGSINSVGIGAGSAGTNTLIGTNALLNNTTGGNNMVVGYNAGYTPAGFTGTNNIYLGAAAVPSNGAATNEIVIGQGATGAGSNTVSIGNTSTLVTNIFGSVRTFSYTVVVSATGYIAVIASSTAGNPLYNTSGIWMVSANATTITTPSGGVTLSATAYVATNVSIPSYSNVFGSVSSSPNVAIVGGTGATLNGYGVFLNIGTSGAYGTYNVNFLRIN
jgi:hypothetical protein